MDDNYYVLSAYSESVDIVIVNDSFSTSEYVAALIAAGYEYQDDDNCYMMGQARIRLMSYYGFTLIRFDDSTIMYKTLDRVIDKAVANNFDLWRLEYLCLPSQNDAVYAYNYAYGTYLSMYYDSENFDVDAYKAELIDAGYTTSDERSYTKGDANIYISSTYIELRYNGNPVTTTNYFNSLLIQDGINLTAEAAYPEESLGLNISFAYISGSNSVHHINMNLINPSEETINRVSINGNIIVEYSVSEGSNNAILSIYDLDKVETSMTLYDALEASSFQLSYLSGYESLIDYELYGSNKYFKINDGEGAFATLKTLLSNNAASSKIYEYDDSVTNVLTFQMNNSSGSPVYKIELVSANIISFTVIYQ
jgi:hypothetical protein